MDSTITSQTTPSPNINENIKTPVGSPMKVPAISPSKTELKPAFIHYRLTHDLFQFPEGLTVYFDIILKLGRYVCNKLDERKKLHSISSFI